MPHGRIAELTRGIAWLLFPNSCLLCEAPEPEATPLRHGFCSTCIASTVADAAPTCPRCAATLGPHTDVSRGCPACREHGFRFDAAFRLGPYAGTLQSAILRTKDAGGEGVAEMLGRLLAEERVTELRAAGIDVVTAVPLHWRSRWKRGFNQAERIAEEIASDLGVEFRPGLLRRVKATPQHAQPSATARWENIRGAFEASPRARVAGKTVLLVDDVMTTGATMSESARVLKDAGAAKVLAAVLARA
jgi:ComF family protein